MEGIYPPGYFCADRDQQHQQQTSQHQQHHPPHPQQHHALNFPLDLPIPNYTTSEHQSNFVVDQTLRAFSLHPGASILHQAYQDTVLVPASSTIAYNHQPSLTSGGHGVKSNTRAQNYAPSTPTAEQVQQNNVEVVAVTPQNQRFENNSLQIPEQDPAPMQTESPQELENEEQTEDSPTSPLEECKISKRQQTPPPSSSNHSVPEPPLLVALNLKKSTVALPTSMNLPPNLAFKVSSKDRVEGVVAKEVIEIGVKFGPYTGDLLDEEHGWSKESTWEVFLSGRLSFYIDGHKTWMSHLRCAQTEEEQNIEAYQSYGEICFRTTKVVDPGSELRVFYSEEYMKRIGIQTRLNDLTFSKDTQQFQCNLCEESFTSAKLVLRHIRIEHNDSQEDEMVPVLTWKKKARKKSIEPKISSKVNPSNRTITKKKIPDEKESSFKCGACEKVFPTSGRLKAHEFFHEFNEDYVCPVCQKKQQNSQMLVRHMMSHEPKIHKCPKCNRKFKSETAREKHVERIHGYICKFCNEKFAGKDECLNHEKTHKAFKSGRSTATPVQCVEKNECGVADGPKDMLGKTPEYYKHPYKCRSCSKRYALRCSAREHEKTCHSNEGSYKCQHCLKVFVTERRLVHHLIAHEQKGFYRCTLCPRSFASPSALNNHQGEHTGLKPFKCELCGRGFRVKSHFHAHKRRMHQDRPMRFFCSVCNKGFADKGNLTKHELRHKGIRQFVCLQCGKGFTAQTSLTNHVRTVHNKDKPFSCDVCGKTFSFNHHYTHHVIKHKLKGDGNTS